MPSSVRQSVWLGRRRKEDVLRRSLAASFRTIASIATCGCLLCFSDGWWRSCAELRIPTSGQRRPDGNTIYFVESHFFRGRPKDAQILLARRNGNAFARTDDSDLILRTVNEGGFNYTPPPSASELEIFFTRLGPNGHGIHFATRSSRTQPFGPAHPIEAISGVVEAPTLSTDGGSLYCHKKENGRFVIYRVTRH